MSFVYSPVFAQAEAVPATQAVQAAPAAPNAAGTAPSEPNFLLNLLPFVLMIAAFWFLLIRPQQKRQKEIAQRQSQLKNGDQVLTSAGIYGKVVGLDGDRVTLQVGEGVRIPFQRQAIVSFIDEKSDNKS